MIKYFKNDELNKIKRLDSFEEKCWVDLINPTDDEIEDVTAITGIPEETLKAALDEEETARIERDDGYFMCLIDTPTITDTDEGDTYETIPMSIINIDECIVTES